MNIPATREQLAELFGETEGLVYVEIGVHQAVFASSLAATWKGQMHLVDPWNPDDVEQFYPSFRLGTFDRDTDYGIAVEAMRPHWSRCHFHRMTSSEAVKKFADESVALVYVDAMHDYHSVLRDAMEWLPKLKSTGWICGHDYHADFPGVIKAVAQVADSVKRPIFETTEPHYPSWAIPMEGVCLTH